MAKRSIVLGGGCFWCLDAIYRLQPGVIEVTSGYAGGDQPEPSYEDIAYGRTSHAEVVKVDFDDSKYKLSEVLDLFFQAHDPTTPNRQGHDIGPQYRSIVLYQPDQKSEVEKAIERAKSVWGDRIVTELKPYEAFYPAEDYHQDFYNKNPKAGYCQVVIAPKIKSLFRE